MLSWRDQSPLDSCLRRNDGRAELKQDNFGYNAIALNTYLYGLASGASEIVSQ